MSEAVKFSNEKIRPAADLLAQLCNLSEQILAEWNARPEVQPANDANPIGDRSGDSGDGRPVGTGAKVHSIINRLQEFKTVFVEDGAVLVAPGRHDTILQFAVNTTPKVG